MTPSRSTGLPTLEDVARVAGVSRATVSRVINDKPNISEKIRVAVEQAVDELHYVPNRAARSLVTKRAGAIGLVVRESGVALNVLVSDLTIVGLCLVTIRSAPQR